MGLKNCHNFQDYRALAKRRLPGPIFNYIDGGIQRGTHVLKALACGAKAVGLGRYYLYPLAAGGQAGVRHAMNIMQAEVVRDMRLMGCSNISELRPSMLSKRK